MVDDGSTDDTPGAIASARGSFPPSFQFHRKENGGPASARNLGIRLSRGSHVVLLQDDIFATPDLLAIHRRGHASRAGEVVVLGQTQWSPDLPRTPFMDFLMEGDQFAFHWIADRENVAYNFFYSSNVSMPRAALDRLGAFDETFPYAAWEDTELGLRLTRGGVRMVYEPEALAFHHHPTTLPAYLRKRRQIGLASTILYRKEPSCGPMMRYDKRPSGAALLAAALPHAVARAAFAAAERLGVDGAVPRRLRRGAYRLLLDYEYFRGVSAGLGGVAESSLEPGPPASRER